MMKFYKSRTDSYQPQVVTTILMGDKTCCITCEIPPPPKQPEKKPEGFTDRVLILAASFATAARGCFGYPKSEKAQPAPWRQPRL